MAERTFDFLVIGAQKCGTTSLWRGMDSHPRIRVPSDKERRFFEVDKRFERGLAEYVRTTFGDPPGEERIGIVSSQLMPADLARRKQVIERIAATCPDVRLVALLRNPIERATSFFRFASRRAGEELSFAAFYRRALERHGGVERTPFIGAGEYGKILVSYLERFERDQILILMTQDLAQDPAGLYRRLFEFLEVDAGQEVESRWLNLGGSHARVTDEALREIRAELNESVWPHVTDPNVKQGFLWWLKQVWNIEPDRSEVEVPAEIRRELAAHYLPDAALLERELSVRVPWVSALEAAADGRHPGSPRPE